MMKAGLVCVLALAACAVRGAGGSDTPCPAGGHTTCPARVAGGYGCMPAGTAGWSGCAGGGTYPTGCCCAPGPANITGPAPAVLIIGDSVSAGYTPFVTAALQGVAQVGHGPDNAGGGNADGSHYGQLCTPFFIKTPLQAPIPWKVITFNYGLHDGGTNVSDYTASLENITSTLQTLAPSAHLLFFLTTVPSMKTPGDAADKKVEALNAAASEVMSKHRVPVVNLHATMMECGATCAPCQPHCSAAGYEYLVSNAIVPAIKKALQG